MSAKPVRFGTFSGVFIPSALAIFGAVMYYIAPKVVGGLGLFRTVLVVLIAHSITIATAFSISSIASNIDVKGGGLYYLISRSLGRELGGSIGIQLFLAQTVASSFYAMAFARAVASILAALNVFMSEMNLALVSIAIFGILVFRGASFVIKIQYFIFTMILLSLASIFLGANPTVAPLSAPLILPFWVGFAMFFPAVTGIDAGVGMSGDLKNPRRSLVVGTFSAIIFTMMVYLALATKLSFAANAADLVSNPYIIHDIALFPQLVILGVLLATSSSALSCFMTAPRSLRAMVQDKLFSNKLSFLGKSIGESNEPRAALLLSLSIATGIIFLGQLETVAQVVAILFLNVYGWINGAAFFEKVSKNPSFRPSFSSFPIIHLYGMLACYTVMYLFNPTVMLVGIGAQVLLFYVLLKTKGSAKSESVWDGVRFQILKKALSKIGYTGRSRKSWRPTIVAFSANKDNKNVIFNILDWINAKASITKLYFLVSGKINRQKKRGEKLEKQMKEFVQDSGIDLYPEVIISDDFSTSIRTILQSEKLGDISFNTIFIDLDERFKLSRLLEDAATINKNIIILRNNLGFSDFKKVDVWWSTPANGNLMMLLAYLITNSDQWKNAVIRLLNVVRKKGEMDKEKSRLEHVVKQSRIENIDVRVILDKRRSMRRIISENSGESDLVIMGLPGLREKQVKLNRIKAYTDDLKISLIVSADEQIDFKVN